MNVSLRNGQRIRPTPAQVIEVDGEIHASCEQRSKDIERQNWLEGEGYRVIRFKDIEIGDSLDRVLGRIRAALA